MVHQVQRVRKALLDQQGSLVVQVHKVLRVLKDSEEKLDPLVKLGREDLLGQLDLQVKRVL